MSFKMSLNRLWQFSYDSKLIDVLRNSKHAIPIIQSFHLFGITLLLASMVILNFRMLGIGLTGISLHVVARQALTWATTALLLTMTSGFLVFLPDPARYAANYSFLTKMCVLSAAILFQYAFYRRVVRREAAAAEPRRHVILPLISLTLWFGVGWAGRAIAFLG
jgi:hypothetical protein